MTDEEHSETEAGRRAVDVAMVSGAAYADARVVDLAAEHLVAREGRVEAVHQPASLGVGVRVIADGRWGFAATGDLSPRAVEGAARLAVDVAHAGRLGSAPRVHLAEVEPVVATWVTPVVEDPFTVPLDDKLALLVGATEAALAVPGTSIAEGRLHAWRRWSRFVSSEGADITQTVVQCGGGMAVTAVGEDETQTRSYPNSFSGDVGGEGYELVRRLDLLAHADRVGEEAVELLSAPVCPDGETTLVLDSSQVALQVHESIGHPVELDRVLGTEAAFAGTSFLTPDDVGQLRYGSPLLNVVADATTPGALGTFGYDDEGVPATSTPVVRDGILAGFLSSRETAGAIGLNASGATMRAQSWAHLPLIRMTNVSLLPGTAASLDELLDGVERGVYLETNRSWSIDDRRVDFQFGTEWGREIRGGRLGRVVRNGAYAGRTRPFWSSLDALGGPDLWKAWGLPNCGKGQPIQTGFVAHGAVPARFRGVQVGSR